MTEPFIDAAFKTAAQSRYADLRALGPIHRTRLVTGLPVWMVVDYELAREALAHPALLKDDTPARGTLDAHMDPRPADRIGPNMLFADPPDHTRLRRLVAAAFTRGRVEALRPRVTAIAGALADQIAAAGEADLVLSYTSLLPVRVICELLGVREREQGQFRDWTRAALGVPSAEQLHAFISLRQYMADLIADKRRAPGDDLLSALVAVRDERDGRLSEEELVGTANLLVIGAVEEFLRFDPSVEHTTMLYAARGIELGGAPIALGAPLARLEAEIGIGTLLRRFPSLRLTIPSTEIGWIPAGIMRGPLSLPVTVSPAQDAK